MNQLSYIIVGGRGADSEQRQGVGPAADLCGQVEREGGMLHCVYLPGKYRGTSPIRKHPPRYDSPTTQVIGLRKPGVVGGSQGGGRFLMSQVRLYGMVGGRGPDNERRQGVGTAEDRCRQVEREGERNDDKSCTFKGQVQSYLAHNKTQPP